MDIEKLIERLRNAAGGPEGIKMCQDATTTLSTLQAENKKLRAELEQVERCIEIVENQRDQMKRERDAAIDCIYKIEDALDRGNDNDWAREHISEWESQKED
jgi:predicted RNase H-like nuclease (RuvC/YqgF family)